MIKMTKKKFLKILEEKLLILNENERKDIINEYKDNLEEKMKHGQTESEAVADFGDIDTLAKEILSAYKINTEYQNDTSKDLGEKTKKIIDQSEGWIKQTASKLSEATQKIAQDMKDSDHEWTVERFFEVLIKIIIFLLCCAVLKLPFFIIEGLGLNILDTVFHPFDYILAFIWRILISLSYIIGCGVLGVIMFKEYFEKKSSQKSVPVKKKERENNHTVTTSEPITPIEKKENKSTSTFTHILFTFLKVMITLIILLPLWMINLGLYFGVGAIIYLMFQGINFFGPFIVLFSLAIAFTYLSSVIYNVIFNRKKAHFWPFIVSTILFVTGCFLSIDQFININYHNTLPENRFEIKEKNYEHQILQDQKITIEGNYASITHKIVDNTLDDGKLLIKVKYYDIMDLDIDREIIMEYDNHIYLQIHRKDHSWINNRKLNKMILNDLKNNMLYNYAKLYEIEVTITANEHTLKQVY